MRKNLLGFLTAGAIMFLALAAVFLWYEWGFWRSTSFELTGIEMPLVERYRTDISDRGREAGYFIVVYSLPDNVTALLEQHQTKLEEYPMFCAGFERDGFTRVNWTHRFPRHDEEANLQLYFTLRGPSPPTPAIDAIRSNQEALAFAAWLMDKPTTYYGGWYRPSPASNPEDTWYSDFYMYLLNLEERVVVMFGMQT